MPKNHKVLRLINVPVFTGLSELAALSSISIDVIRGCCFSERHYFVFKIPKKSGGFRWIYEPDRNLKAIQRWILRKILDNLNPSVFATAFRKKTNLTSNVSPHASNRYFYCLDLKNFFPSITKKRVKSVFSTIGYSDSASELLAELCTYKDFLPQGAVTSPALSNLIASKLDHRINGYAAKRNITYTRYADDITLSSNNCYSLFKIQQKVNLIIKDEKFSINPKKIHFSGPRRRCAITGLVKNSSQPKFSLGRRKIREMRVVMHRFLNGRGLGSRFNSVEAIEGYLSYAKSVDPQAHSILSKYWIKLRQKMNINSGEKK